MEISEPSEGLDPFRTTEFTLNDLYGDINPEMDNSGSLDISGEDLLTENFTGLTEAQVESILSETDLKALADVDIIKDDKKIAITDDLLEELVKDVDTKDSFLLHGQSRDGRTVSGQRRKRELFGSSLVQVTPAAKEPVYIDKIIPDTPKIKPKPVEKPSIPVPTSKIIVEEVNEVPIKVEKKRKEDNIEEQISHGIQLKTVQTKHSPLKKHIITSAHRRGGDVTIVTSEAPQPQIVTVAVSDSLKVCLSYFLGFRASKKKGLLRCPSFRLSVCLDAFS